MSADEIIENMSPLHKQYFTLQQKYPDYIICCQIGDFYEILGKDNLGLKNMAKIAHKKAGIQLTKKNKNLEESPDMCGVPIHSSEGYFQKLVNAGETIVVVTQKGGGKNVERYIDKIISPGTIVENISEEKSNYFACLYDENPVVGVSLVDLSTGEVKITEVLKDEINDYLNKVNPSEILICGNIELCSKKFKLVHHKRKVKIKDLRSSGKILSHVYELKAPTSNPEYFITQLGIEKWLFGTLAFSNLVNYLSEDNQSDYYDNLLKKLDKPKVFNQTKHLNIPLNGYKSLEIFENQTEINSKENLVSRIDLCKTAMGRRKLREWLREPLVDIDEINKRYDVVDHYIENNIFYEELDYIYDISRISRRMFLSKLKVQEIKSFYNSLLSSLKVFKKESNEKCVQKTESIIDYLESNIDFEKISDYVSEDYLFFKGKVFESLEIFYNNYQESQNKLNDKKNEYDQIADQYLDNKKSRKRSFNDIIKVKTGFKLKGPKSFYNDLKDHIKLKKLEQQVEIIDPAWDILQKVAFAEQQKYLIAATKAWKNFQKELSNKFAQDFLVIADEIAEIDVLHNFAYISKMRDYKRPKLIENDHAYFSFKTLRHPVVELNKNLEESFIPNDIILDEEKDIMCIYGANSSGKSTLLKSIALNFILAQIGCFGAFSEESELTPLKSILTRMTTYDSLSEGLSTFTMEMKELSIALKHTKEKALFLFDEIGRGTSVEDGEAIAFATLEYLSNSKNKGLTFFATHYHDLVGKINTFENIEITHLECYIDEKGKLVFPRNLKSGAGSGSYGIEVAKSCGLPDSMIRVAQNYNKKYAPLKFSRYNKKVMGIICPFCEENPVQETHHKINQEQGKVKEIIINGIKKSINHKENLIMICGSCHNKITEKEMQVVYHNKKNK